MKNKYYYESFWIGLSIVFLNGTFNGNITTSILGACLFVYGLLFIYNSEKCKQEDDIYQFRYIFEDKSVKRVQFNKNEIENNLVPVVGDIMKLDDNPKFFKIKKRVFFQEQDKFVLCFEVEEENTINNPKLNSCNVGGFFNKEPQNMQ